MPHRVAVAVVEHRGHFLVGVRGAKSALGGFHEFPGGGLELNETPSEATIRECKEETGVEVNIVRLLRELECEYPHGYLHLYFYLCQPRASGLSLQLPLSGNFRWVPREDLGGLRFPYGNEEVLKILLSPEFGIK